MPEEIKNVLELLEKNNYKAYVIGGYVRDKLINKKSYDIDIATNATPIELIKIFKNKKIKEFKYGNISFKEKDYSFDITTFRKDYSYLDKRKPSKVVYIDTLEEDVLRRDFTINAIAIDKNEQIIDLTNGVKDLKKKIVKAINDPYKEIEEDSLRILRAIRLATILNFKIEDNLKRAIIKNKESLRNLSYERKKEELTKIFTNSNKRRGVKLLKELKLLEVLDLKNIDNVLKTKHTLGMWATITESYPFNKNELSTINKINKLLNEDINDKLVLYKYGSYEINVVCDLKKINKTKIIKKYEALPIHDKKEIAITAEEICSILKKDAGSFLKIIYDDLEKNILLSKLPNEKEKIKTYIKYKYM